jgi:Transposase DDE domain group 1
MIPLAEAAHKPIEERQTVIDEDIALPFDLPAVARKKVSAAFDGGRITSDGGVMLLAQAERRLGVAERLAAVMPDGRDASRVIHLLPDILRARIFAIACGYEDADDLDWLRPDPAFKLACSRLPDTGRDLCSQPTIFALGECAILAGSNPPDERDGRPLLCQLRGPARSRDARYRRYG